MSVPVRQKPVVGSRVPRDRCPCAARQKPMVGRVVLNAPREMPPRRLRPSWDSWIRPSLTEARLSPVRQKPVGKPVCRPLHVRRGIVCDKPVACPFPVRGKSAAAPPPISECRKMSASDECPPVRRPSEVRRWPVESPPRVAKRPFPWPKVDAPTSTIGRFTL